MEGWCLSTHHKSSSWLMLFILLISLINFMVKHVQANGVCIEEERKALLEIKASLQDSSAYDEYWSSKKVLLSTWVDESSHCCEWERVKCDSTTGRRHITHLSLSNMFLSPYETYDDFGYQLTTGWQLNFSIFLHFEDLRSLDLSYNRINSMNTDFEMISNLKKLELLIISKNDIIVNDFFPSLSALTSLKVLDLGYNIRSEEEYHDISELAALENLEVLDLTWGGYYGNFQMQDSAGRDSVILKNLKILNLGGNHFNESLIPSLRFLPSLKSLHLHANYLSGPFPAEDLSYLTQLEKLDLSFNYLESTPSVGGCKRLLRLRRLESVALAYNTFNKSIVSCLSFLPSLNTLDLTRSLFGSSFPTQELLSLRNLEVLLMGDNGFNGRLPMEAFASHHNLEVLDLSFNRFVGSIPLTIRSLSSLRAVSFSGNKLNGSLPLDHGLCDLENLYELDLSMNMLDGNLPECFKRLSYLKLLDISSNQFKGTIPPSLIANLTYMEYVDFSHNQFGGSFSFSSFSNHTKLEMVKFDNEKDMFEVETEYPVGWIPMFQLKVLVLQNCNINRHKGSVIPSFLFYQHELVTLDVSHNSMKGEFPSWLIQNNTMLEYLNLRNNLIGGSIRIPFYGITSTLYLDVSRNLLNSTIPRDMPEHLPNILQLNLSSNFLGGAIPSSFGNLSKLYMLDLSHNELSGQVPTGLLTNVPNLQIVKLSNNRLDNNYFTGKIGNDTTKMTSFPSVTFLDMSNNFFTGKIPVWISNLSSLSELLLRNNRLEGEFPCGTASFKFLDISQNSFSGSIPSCLNWGNVEHLHLGSNRFTGTIPTFFRNLTKLFTLDIRNNNLSGRIPTFLGELYNLRILLLGKNNFIGSISNKICQLNNANLVDLSSNSLCGSIPSCLHNITIPPSLVFYTSSIQTYLDTSTYLYKGFIHSSVDSRYIDHQSSQDEVLFTTKSVSRSYKGNILDYMSGLDLSCNKLTGEIPPELGMLTQIHTLNLSHNQLRGPIPVSLSNLRSIESLDLSSNCLSGNIPSELIKLNSLAVFNVSHNNLLGNLPEMKAQFSTFEKGSYEGNPLLCGPPLDNKCTTASQRINPSIEEGSDEKWYDIDMTSFYGSCGSTWFIFIFGFVTALYINPYWRRRWLYLIEECMYTSYYFHYDFVRKFSLLFHKVGRV